MSICRRLSPQTKLVPDRTKHQPILKIKVDQHLDSKIYTSGSFVSGWLEITSQADLAFQNLGLVFKGVSTSQVALCQHAVLPSMQVFLQRSLPISIDSPPNNRILEAGNSYIIPFAFNIPTRLPDAACQHKDDLIRERHLQLPPTVGSWVSDDSMGRCVRIEYLIEARLILPGKKSKSPSHIQNSHPIRVMPYLPERPPLCIDSKSTIYRMSHEKFVKKNILSRNVASITASVTQPPPIFLSDSLSTSGSMIKVDLQFTTISANVPLPDVYAQYASLEATTTHSLGHMGYFPDEQKQDLMGSDLIVSYRTSNRLDIGQSEKLVWEKTSTEVEEAEYIQESSAITHSAMKRCTSTGDVSEAGHVTYKASLFLPIRVPGTLKKLFLPTFYSCLASRTYAVRVSLTSGRYKMTLPLTMPIQIVSEDCTPPPYIEKPRYVCAC
ncbi:hypothetical protein N7478_002362 [Penicillium angulare]|uniref:uncharacterized protein n=1 Tax=Penicillium angulare TaxID=116970 RepID=UPI00253F8838|nr:uncharacterized protein N7478_002362 [Penicillium angulare]KAJ5286676.1 hypothetical protein N7478_002362 [Penicillium angulare]